MKETRGLIPLVALMPALEALPQLRSLALDSFNVTEGSSRLRGAVPQLLELRLHKCRGLEGARTVEALAAAVENLQARIRAAFRALQHDTDCDRPHHLITPGIMRSSKDSTIPLSK